MSECTDDLREVSKLLLPDRPCSSDVCAEAADYIEALVDEVEAVTLYGDSLRAENKRLRGLLIENWTDEVELLEAALQEGE